MSKGCVNKDLISGFLIPNSFRAIFPGIIVDLQENVQKVSIPPFSIGYTKQASRGNTELKIAGNSSTYSTLNITFIMDQNLIIYDMIMAWIKACAYPENTNQYKEFTEKYAETHNKSLEEVLYQDITIMSTSGTLPMAWHFKYCFPTTISGIEFDTTYSTPTIATVTVGFEYTYFDVKNSGTAKGT